MTATRSFLSSPAPLCAVVALFSLALAGCSSRDEVLSEKVARAEAAAKKAEKAQKAAEAIAAALGAKIAAPAPEASTSADDEDDDDAGLDNPDSDRFDNTIVAPQQANAG